MRAVYLYIGGSQVYLVLYIRPGLLLYSNDDGMRLGRLWLYWKPSVSGNGSNLSTPFLHDKGVWGPVALGCASRVIWMSCVELR